VEEGEGAMKRYFRKIAVQMQGQGFHICPDRVAQEFRWAFDTWVPYLMAKGRHIPVTDEGKLFLMDIETDGLVY
jgi:hypothetical protein